MEGKELRKLRSKVIRLFKENNEGSVIGFYVNGEVKGTYEIPIRHFVSIDMKTPTAWLNENICFEVDLREIKTNEKLDVDVKIV